MTRKSERPDIACPNYDTALFYDPAKWVKAENDDVWSLEGTRLRVAVDPDSPNVYVLCAGEQDCRQAPHFSTLARAKAYGEAQVAALKMASEKTFMTKSGAKRWLVRRAEQEKEPRVQESAPRAPRKPDIGTADYEAQCLKDEAERQFEHRVAQMSTSIRACLDDEADALEETGFPELERRRVDFLASGLVGEGWERR